VFRALASRAQATCETQLGEKICLSPAAVQRRLRRLRERKIIEADVAVVSPDAVGRSLIAIVEVTLDMHLAKTLEEFERAIQSAPEVMQGYYVTGNADFILVTAKSMEDYNAFVLEFLSKKAHVKHFNTSVVMRRVKWGIALPTAPTCEPKQVENKDNAANDRARTPHADVLSVYTDAVIRVYDEACNVIKTHEHFIREAA
jgi:Lrp/AsnC family leucine-responsive transcriptional regulator